MSKKSYITKLASLAVAGLMLIGSSAVITPRNYESGNVYAQPMTQTKEGSYTSNNLPTELDAYADFSTLPYLKNSAFTEQVSSTDPQGGNNDGYGWQDGRNGDVSQIKDKVLLDAQGPGVIYRMWFTGSTESMSQGRIKFFFDGETKARYDVDYGTFFRGEFPPFEKPFVLNSNESSGGYTVMLPIAFSKRIVIKADMPFYYNINYQILPSDSGIKTFTGKFDQAAYDLAIANMTPSKRVDGLAVDKTQALPKGTSIELANITGKNQINQIQLCTNDIYTFDHLQPDPIYDDGIAFGGVNNPDGFVQFDLNLDPGNKGAKIVRRVDTSIGGQTVAVYVDGQKVGNWAVEGGSVKYRWFDSHFQIPESFTAGKSKVTVKLEFVSSVLDVNIFYVWMYSHIDGEYVLSDEYDIKFANIGNTNPEHKGFIAGGVNWSGDGNHMYDPMLDEQNKITFEKVTALTQKINIQVYYNGEETPSVDAPIGSFFGYGEIGPAEMSSYMLGFVNGIMYCNFPMPFEDSARVVLTNNSDTDLEEVISYVNYEPFAGDFRQVGYFKTKYTRYEPTTPTEYMTVLKTEGSGHFVGLVQTMSGDLGRSYLEGDELVYIDGSLTASMYGTGTEDIYNGAWYFAEGTFFTPWFGNPQHAVTSEYDSTSCYRLFLTDAVSFRTGIDFKLEHGPHNDTQSIQALLGMYYHNDTKQMELTDSFDLAKDTDLTKNMYTFSGGRFNYFTAIYDGIYRSITKEGVINNLSEAGAYSQFVININDNNGGVYLRKLTDQSVQNQNVKVYVNGTYIGNWNSRNSYYADYAKEDVFFIPSKYSDGHKQLLIKLVVEDGCVWTEGEYEIFSVAPMVIDTDNQTPGGNGDNGNNPNPGGGTEEPNSPKNNTGLMIAIAAGAVALIGGGGAAALFLIKKKD